VLSRDSQHVTLPASHVSGALFQSPGSAASRKCCVTVIMQHFPARLPGLAERPRQSEPVLIDRARTGPVCRHAAEGR
jgi:hypothetical protein